MFTRAIIDNIYDALMSAGETVWASDRAYCTTVVTAMECLLSGVPCLETNNRKILPDIIEMYRVLTYAAAAAGAYDVQAMCDKIVREFPKIASTRNVAHRASVGEANVAVVPALVRYLDRAAPSIAKKYGNAFTVPEGILCVGAS